MRKTYDLIDQRFGKWIVISRTSSYRGNARWHVICDCGNKSTVQGNCLRKGRSQGCKSCGNTIHGFNGTRIHIIWMNMIDRCTRPGNKDWCLYGGRGITVCKRWRENFLNFLEDMGESAPRLTIDRIDNEKGYSKKNCRWADSATQARNKRTFIKDGTIRGTWKLLERLAAKDRVLIQCIMCEKVVEKSFTQFRGCRLGRCSCCK